MYKNLILLAAAILSSFVFGLPGQATALAGGDFRKERIIDDVVFFTSNTMGPTEIQNFLNAKVPVCNTWHAGRGGNQPPFTCLKDYHQPTPNRGADAYCNGHSGSDKSAAYIIYEVAQSCGINPQVLIVLLQKEQALITDTWPWSSQYRAATGFGCPDTAACDSQYYGFFNQVYAAARQYRVYARHPERYNHRPGRENSVRFHPNAACGSANVFIQTQATAGLYNYTPYQPNAAALNNLYGTGDGCSAYGNRNFWRLFNDWFGTPVIGAVPSPLYKSADTQRIYALAGGKKHHVPSMDIMIAYGLHRFGGTTVSENFLNQYATGDALNNVAKKAFDPTGTIYLFDDGRRYPINGNDCAKHLDGTTNAATTWAIDCFNSGVTKSVTNELVDLYTHQEIPLPQIVLNNNAGWFIQGGKKRLITDPIFVYVYGGWGKTRWMKDGTMSQPVGKLLIPDMSVVKFNNSPAMYMTVYDQLFPIPSMDEYAAWGLNRRPSYLFPSSYNASDPLTVSSQPLRVFARNSAGIPYVLLANGTKASLAGVTNNWNVPSYTTNLPDHALNQIPTVPLSTIFRSSSGAIYTTQGDKQIRFPSIEDILGSGFSFSQIQPVTRQVEDLFTYDGMRLAPGRLFKVSGSTQIRYVQGEGASLAVNSLNIPGLPYDRGLTVDAATGARYPVVGNYQ